MSDAKLDALRKKALRHARLLPETKYIRVLEGEPTYSIMATSMFRQMPGGGMGGHVLAKAYNKQDADYIAELIRRDQEMQ